MPKCLYCEKDAVANYRGEDVCMDHALRKKSEYIADLTRSYHQDLADIQNEFKQSIGNSVGDVDKP
jgi:hypothetical protein